MNILITNDDGIHAEGILALKNALESIGRVFVVAPDRPRSACGHSITLHKPLRAEPVKLADGSIGFASNGTPSDCVSLGLLGVIDEKIDVVVSGINRGPNLGWDLTYSGTVSAAMEGAISGLPSLAISIATYDLEVDYSVAGVIACKLVQMLANQNLPKGTLLNVNVPALPASEIKGVAVTRQGKREYINKLDKRTDPSGRSYYWFGGDAPVDTLTEGTDVKAVSEGWISVTPVHIDLTDYQTISLIESWGLQDIGLIDSGESLNDK
ncbi:MAG: 5'/3'-nucleotidase SurE [Armatimonadetes bacterium]|nr:5'/3'-nucleotidase SurE [Armatimonadota bacterium]